RAVRADEGDAGRTSAQVIFERPGPLGRQCSLDVFAEEIDALLAMVDRGRQRALPGGSRLDGWVSQPTCMQRCTSTNADSAFRVISRHRRIGPASRAAQAGRGAGGLSPPGP